MEKFEINGVKELKKEELKEIQGGLKLWKALLGFVVALAVGLIASGGDGTF